MLLENLLHASIYGLLPRLVKTLVPQNQDSWVKLVRHIARLCINAPDLELDDADLVFNFLRRHVVFVLDRFLLQAIELHNSIPLFSDDFLG